MADLDAMQTTQCALQNLGQFSTLEIRSFLDTHILVLAVAWLRLIIKVSHAACTVSGTEQTIYKASAWCSQFAPVTSLKL